MKVESSASTKVILVGEHAVVYGKRAVALPFSARTRISIEESEEYRVNIFPEEYLDMGNEILAQLRIVCEQIGVEVPLSLEVEFEGAPGRGLGVSASLAVALVRGVLKFSGKALDDEDVIRLVEDLEIRNHGNPSGIDHTTIVFEEAILYQKSERGPGIMILPDVMSSPLLAKCYLVDTGAPAESTKEMIGLVKANMEIEPEIGERKIGIIDELILPILDALGKNDFYKFRAAINEVGEILEYFGIVCDEVKEFSGKLRDMGAAAKVSGAGGATGGSGFMLVLPENEVAFEDLCREYGFAYQKLIKK